MAAPVLDEFTIPVRAEPWTLDDWLALPPTANHVELVDGMLVVSSMEAFQNRRLMLRIVRQLGDAAPSHLEALPDVNAALGESRGLIPDFVVTDAPEFDGKALPGARFVLVGEIASRSTRRYDRSTKRALYAEAGIPYLMLVDPGGTPVAELYGLRSGEYVEIARSEHGVLEMTDPFPLTLDLTDPRRRPTPQSERRR